MSLSEKALFSIILPVRNEEEHIEGALESIACQTYSKSSLEIIVVDGCSDDGTREKIMDFAKHHPNLNLRVLNNPEHIFSTGFNAGAREAMGDIIMMMGGHCKLDQQYIQCCVSNILATNADCVGGIIHTKGEGVVAEAIALAMSSRFGVGGADFRLAKNRLIKEVDTVAFGAYRRSVFERIGYLDTTLVRDQDDEFNYRLRDIGGKVVLSSDIRAEYFSRGDLRSLWRQYFQYGFYKVLVMQKHVRQMRARHFAPPLFVAAALGGGLLAPFFYPVWQMWLFMLASYIAMNLAFSWRIASEHGTEYFSRLPAVFFVLHFSYGLGFLMGLLKFANRWHDRNVA